MKVVVLLALILVLTTPARAQETLSEIATQMKKSPVYVGPGFPGVDDAVISQLNRQLNEDDHIILVLLPEADYGAFTANDLARDLSNELGNQYIIGLALDSQVVVYAPILPEGVGTDLMGRATSLANNNPVTALSTFIQNVHKWQDRNVMPTPVPTPPPIEQTEQEESGTPLWLTFGTGSAIAGCIIAAVLWFRIYRGRTNILQATRNQVRLILSEIQELGNRISDRRLRQTLEGLVQDAHRYLGDDSRLLVDLTNMQERLIDVNDILVKYVDIQNNGRYYRNPERQLQQGKEAINDFKEAVLEMILQNSDQSLADYRLDTNILKAQREVLDL